MNISYSAHLFHTAGYSRDNERQILISIPVNRRRFVTRGGLRQKQQNSMVEGLS
jgi:hypothetical protein